MQDLIRKLLTVDPKRRITAAEACEHPWLSTARGNLTQHDLGAGLEKLKIFNATRKLRAAIRSVRKIVLFGRLGSARLAVVFQQSSVCAKREGSPTVERCGLVVLFLQRSSPSTSRGIYMHT